MMGLEEKTYTRKTGTPTRKTEPTIAPVGNRKRTAASADSTVQRRIAPEDRHRWIAERAFYKAQRRGFQGGSPEQDWLEAEAEIDAMLTRTRGGAD